MEFNLLFESSPKRGYVGVLADSALVKGLIASQDAGSSNGDIYYQIGGGGLNGFFASALGPMCAGVNRALVDAYDAHFGAGAWKADSEVGRRDRLTSFYIPLAGPRPALAQVGERVAGLVYSVGPVLHKVIVDRDGFRAVYVDALNAVAAANRNASDDQRIDALRITLLSTGIYGNTETDEEAALLARDVASVVLEALVAAGTQPQAQDLPTTILINTNYAGPNESKEVDAFSHAAAARGIAVDAEGFKLQVS